MDTARRLTLNTAYQGMVDAANDLSYEHGVLYYIYNNNAFTAVVGTENERDSHIKATPACAVYEANRTTKHSERVY